MKDETELKKTIDELEASKAGLIIKIKDLNKRLRYKKYEQKALEPFLEKTKEIQIGPLRRMKRSLEFKISTQAYTPRMERELLKQMKKVDDRLKEIREIEWARRKKKLVDNDITESEKQVVEIEVKLKEIRDELKQLYEDGKALRVASKKGAKFNASPEGGFVSLADILAIEDKKKKTE